MVLHAGLSGVSHYGRFWRTGAPSGGGGFEGFKHAAFPLVAFQDRGISDTFAALICHGVLERFPTLQLASIENGAMWVPDLLRNLQRRLRQDAVRVRATTRSSSSARQVWVAPVLRGRHGAG